MNFVDFTLSATYCRKFLKEEPSSLTAEKVLLYLMKHVPRGMVPLKNSIKYNQTTKEWYCKFVEPKKKTRKGA